MSKPQRVPSKAEAASAASDNRFVIAQHMVTTVAKTLAIGLCGLVLLTVLSHCMSDVTLCMPLRCFDC